MSKTTTPGSTSPLKLGASPSARSRDAETPQKCNDVSRHLLTVSRDIAKVELRGLEPFSVAKVAPACSTHVHIGARGASRPSYWQIGGEHGANAVDLPSSGNAHSFGPPTLSRSLGG
jgi:hypothetical protein